jgi:hypothetical protein
MTTTEPRAAYLGRPARELDDDELERQGTNAHETRNWVFLHGTAEQFATHTARMLELEQEFLRRHPKRTWQGLRGILVQLEALLEPPAGDHEGAAPAQDPAAALLRSLAQAPGGRLNKLEVHQLAREVGLDRTALARLYRADPPLLVTDKQDRVITEAGRARADAHS